MKKLNQVAVGFWGYIASAVYLFLSGCSSNSSDSAGNPLVFSSPSPTATPSITPVPTPSAKHIFATTAVHNGAFGANVTAAMAAADAFCNADAGNTDHGTYKALLASSIRSTSTNWVLHASTQYLRLTDNAIIGTTTSSGTFTFPLTHYFSPASYDWSGFNADWSNSAATCSDWTVGTGSSTGGTAFPNYTSSKAIDDSPVVCSASYVLTCVEQ